MLDSPPQSIAAAGVIPFVPKYQQRPHLFVETGDEV